MVTAPAWARNIDLSTVPNRDTVQLTIYNSEDLTLVRETRKVSFKQGANGLQFSWANTLIDPSSVELRVPHPARQAGSLGHHLPARQAANALLERAKRDRRRGHHRNHLFHQRHHPGRPITSALPTPRRRTCVWKVLCASRTTRAKNTKTPRSGWWWAKSISSKKSPNWHTFLCRMSIN